MVGSLLEDEIHSVWDMIPTLDIYFCRAMRAELIAFYFAVISDTQNRITGNGEILHLGYAKSMATDRK